MMDHIWWVIKSEESNIEVSHDDVKLRAVMMHDMHIASLSQTI